MTTCACGLDNFVSVPAPVGTHTITECNVTFISNEPYRTDCVACGYANDLWPNDTMCEYCAEWLFSEGALSNEPAAS